MKQDPAKLKPLKIAFIHPDLGIGGAERLIVDAAVGLQSIGHSVKIYTSHHNPDHSFEETRNKTLSIDVFGDFLPRSLFGSGMILFAMIRSLYLGLRIVLMGQKFDVLIVDQISVSIPILLLTRAKVLFYCHFPDKLLSKKKSPIKRIYRIPFDYIEEFTTNFAHVIVVNSKFTATVFKNAFKSIKRTPEVLYPAINFSSYSGTIDETHPENTPLLGKRFILSINRFERKKDLHLALHAFAKISCHTPDLHLIIAGGYDPRVSENIELLRELTQLAVSSNLHPCTFTKTNQVIPEIARVIFIPSFSDRQRTFLLKNCECLVYTPSFEHFGIVPVEGMYAGAPVIAVNNGGPVESILDGKCGLLVDSTISDFQHGIQMLLNKSKDERKRMGVIGREHVVEKFSLGAFVSRLDEILQKMSEMEGGIEYYFVGFIFLLVSAFLYKMIL